jgi:hypothetical protein
MTENTEISETLDALEEILITEVLPVARIIKEKRKIDTDERIIARNLIGKIGARILFGKSPEVDKILTGQK